MKKYLRFRRLLKLSIVVAIFIAVGVPALHLVATAVHDQNSITAVATEHVDDASRLSSARVQEVWQIPAAPQAAEQQLIELLARAQREQLSVSIAGARHSMGGHTIAADGIVIDMLPFKAMRLSAESRAAACASASANSRPTLPTKRTSPFHFGTAPETNRSSPQRM